MINCKWESVCVVYSCKLFFSQYSPCSIVHVLISCQFVFLFCHNSYGQVFVKVVFVMILCNSSWFGMFYFVLFILKPDFFYTHLKSV